METGLVIGFIESTQSPDYVNWFIRRKILISRIGCAKAKFRRLISYNYDLRVMYVTTPLTWNERTSVRDDVDAIFSHCSIKLIAVQTAKKLVSANTFVLAENFSTLVIMKTLISVLFFMLFSFYGIRFYVDEVE